MSSGFHTTYGYDYVLVSRKNGGRRIINQYEARWVHRMYSWLINDGMTISAIRDKLTSLNIPGKMGRHWCRATVISILKNPAYTGKTHAFTSVENKPRNKPRDE